MIWQVAVGVVVLHILWWTAVGLLVVVLGRERVQHWRTWLAHAASRRRAG